MTGRLLHPTAPPSHTAHSPSLIPTPHPPPLHRHVIITRTGWTRHTLYSPHFQTFLLDCSASLPAEGNTDESSPPLLRSGVLTHPVLGQIQPESLEPLSGPPAQVLRVRF